MGWSFNPFGFQKNLALMQNLVTSYAEELLILFLQWLLVPPVHSSRIDLCCRGTPPGVLSNILFDNDSPSFHSGYTWCTDKNCYHLVKAKLTNGAFLDSLLTLIYFSLELFVQNYRNCVYLNNRVE